MSGDQIQVPRWAWTPPLPAAVSPPAAQPEPGREVESPQPWSPRQIVVALAAAAIIAGLGTAAVAWGDRGATTSQNGPGGFGGNRTGQGGFAPGGNGQAGFGPGGFAPGGAGANSQNGAS